jgi:hypothetical protein
VIKIESYVFLTDNKSIIASRLTTVCKKELGLNKVQASIISHYTIPSYIIIMCKEILLDSEYQAINEIIQTLDNDGK